MKKYNFEYIVIGGGVAGCKIALELAKAKKNVALVEKSHLGGSNINLRDIPYTINLRFANLISNLADYPEIGGEPPHYNLPALISRQRRITSRLRRSVEQSLQDAGITIINGRAHLLDHHTVSVNKAKYTAAKFILATGATPKPTDIVGLDITPYLLPEDAIKLNRLPKSVIVIGGGPTGCETAEYFAKLGAKVALVEQAKRLLPSEDSECGEAIAKYFTDQLGITVLTGAKAVATTPYGQSGAKVTIASRGMEHTARTACIVLANGSAPYTDYGLENAGVKYDSCGIKTNSLLQTSVKHIYAIGDCIKAHRSVSSTEIAEYQASVLAANLLHRAKTVVNYNGFARIVNTTPCVASVGLNDSDLQSKHRRYKTSIIPLSSIPWGKVSDYKYGFVKIISNSKHHIVGATIVAPHADLMIGELSLAVRHHLSAIEIASTPHIASSLSYAIKLAAKHLV